MNRDKLRTLILYLALVAFFAMPIAADRFDLDAQPVSPGQMDARP